MSSADSLRQVVYYLISIRESWKGLYKRAEKPGVRDDYLEVGTGDSLFREVV